MESSWQHQVINKSVKVEIFAASITSYNHSQMQLILMRILPVLFVLLLIQEAHWMCFALYACQLYTGACFATVTHEHTCWETCTRLLHTETGGCMGMFLRPFSESISCASSTASGCSELHMLKCGRWEGVMQHHITHCTPTSPWHLTIPVTRAQSHCSTPHLLA